MTKEITVAVPYAYIESMPGIKALCKILSSNNFIVNIWTIRKENHKKPTFNNENIRVNYIGPRYKGIKSGATGIAFLISFLLRFIAGINADKSQVTPLVGIGLKGGLVSCTAAILLRREFVYYSMELYCAKPSIKLNSIINYLAEKIICKYAKKIIIQDKPRADEICMAHRVPIDRFEYLPNSDNEKARRNKCTFLHKEHNIQNEKLVLLYIGALSDTCKIKEIIDSFQNAPGNWVLVIHSKWDGLDHAVSSYVDEMKCLDINSRVILRNQPVPQDELIKLIDSADAGIALYDNKSENVNLVGLSSGKIANYLASGLPIIVSDQPSLNVFVGDYKAGVKITSASEIPDALEYIAANSGVMTTESIRCFDEMFSTSIYKNGILNIFRGNAY